MSANIPDTKLVSELLKPTGYICPENLEDKTFEEATEGGGGDVELEDNKSAAINVTAYTSPVVVNPTEGKDAMKKVTVTLTNIPSGGVTLYAWKEKTTNDIVYTNFSVAPTKIDAMDLNYKILYSSNGALVYSTVVAWAGIGQGEGYFTSDQDWGIEDSSFETESEYSRYAEGDIVLQA